MFSTQFQSACARIAALRTQRPGPLESLRPHVASDFLPLLWHEEFGASGALDSAILARSSAVKFETYARRVFAIVPIYVSSICSENCVYCNYRAGNKGVGVERRRLTDEELALEAQFLVEEKGLRALELVYAADPKMQVDVMCRHVELVRRMLERHGGGLVAISAEGLAESDYRRLVAAGLSMSVIWQETYDDARYPALHPGNTRKANFRYRLDAYDRMLLAGVPLVGIGVLSGLADWREDWAMLMLHEEYLRTTYGQGATILGVPRLKSASGALLQESPFTPTRDEYLAVVALHNLFVPTTAAFVSTREEWDVCVELARGGGCLFTLNCSTTPGGYALQYGGCQFTSHSYDAPVYAEKLRALGLDPVFLWSPQDLTGGCRRMGAIR
jgi:2-iminoacetate synthase